LSTYLFRLRCPLFVLMSIDRTIASGPCLHIGINFIGSALFQILHYHAQNFERITIFLMKDIA
jgi:hypothetical protein